MTIVDVAKLNLTAQGKALKQSARSDSVDLDAVSSTMGPVSISDVSSSSERLHSAILRRDNPYTEVLRIGDRIFTERYIPIS